MGAATNPIAESWPTKATRLRKTMAIHTRRSSMDVADTLANARASRSPE
jgi:hypothetical protein